MKATTTEVQNNFGKYLKIAANEEIVITRNNKEVAKLTAYVKEKKRNNRVLEGSAAYTCEDPFRVTYQEYLRITKDSINRYEYIYGVIYLLASPTFSHQNISSEIYLKLSEYLSDKKCKPIYAPFDVTIEVDEEKNIVQPDIVVICDHENIDEKGKYHGTPSMVIEILSPSTRSKDMTVKLDLYMRSGIKEYWVVNPEAEKVDVFSFSDSEISKTSTYRFNEKIVSLIYNGLEIKL